MQVASDSGKRLPICLGVDVPVLIVAPCVVSYGDGVSSDRVAEAVELCSRAGEPSLVWSYRMPNQAMSSITTSLLAARKSTVAMNSRSVLSRC